MSLIYERNDTHNTHKEKEIPLYIKNVYRHISDKIYL